MNKMTRSTWSIAAVLFFAVLGGCSGKPPGCSDPQTLALARQLVLDNLEKTPHGDAWLPYETVRANDPDGLWEKFKAGLNINLSTITTGGYDAASKRHSCEGTLEVSEGELSFSMPIEYSTQGVEGEDGKFVLRTSDFDPATMKIREAAWSYWRNGRYVGEWNGQLACDGLDGETTGAKGPFAMPVSAAVAKDLRIELKRITHGGGSESLAGIVDETGKLGLSGRGANSPDDEWTANYDGQIKGHLLTAAGSIAAAGAASSRSCRLSLQHADPVQAPAAKSSR